MANARNSWRDRLKHAFAVTSDTESLTDADRDLIRRVVEFLQNRELVAPAVAALEVSRPYTFLGNQFLTFMRPFARIALPGEDYDRLTRLMENRSSVDVMLDALEKAGRGE